MSGKIILNRDTKLADLLTVFPWLKDELPYVNEKFKLLHTPLAGVMLKKATVAEMSKRSGIEEQALIEKLDALIMSAA